VHLHEQRVRIRRIAPGLDLDLARREPLAESAGVRGRDAVPAGTGFDLGDLVHGGIVRARSEAAWEFGDGFDADGVAHAAPFVIASARRRAWAWYSLSRSPAWISSSTVAM